MLHEARPSSKVLVHALFPRGGDEQFGSPSFHRSQVPSPYDPPMISLCSPYDLPMISSCMQFGSPSFHRSQWWEPVRPRYYVHASDSLCLSRELAVVGARASKVLRACI